MTSVPFFCSRCLQQMFFVAVLWQHPSTLSFSSSTTDIYIYMYVWMYNHMTAAPVGWPRWPRDRGIKQRWALWVAMTAWPRRASIQLHDCVTAWPRGPPLIGKSQMHLTARTLDRGQKVAFCRGTVTAGFTSKVLFFAYISFCRTHFPIKHACVHSAAPFCSIAVPTCSGARHGVSGLAANSTRDARTGKVLVVRTVLWRKSRTTARKEISVRPVLQCPPHNETQPGWLSGRDAKLSLGRNPTWSHEYIRSFKANRPVARRYS